jgi:hypothetical protein
MQLHDILRRHRGLCWELLRKSRAKSSQHRRFSIAVLLNNLKSHQTARVNGFSSVHNSGLINLNDSRMMFCVGCTVLTVTVGGDTMSYSAI